MRMKLNIQNSLDNLENHVLSEAMRDHKSKLELVDTVLSHEIRSLAFE